MSNLEQKFNLFLKEAEAQSSSTTSTQNENEFPVKNLLPKPETKADGKKTFWWLKGASKTDNSPSEIASEDATARRLATPTQSSVSSSMAEFLHRERICADSNVNSKAAEENKTSTDKLPSVHAESSATKADYSDDFTDDDISSIMDQLSQLAGSGGDDSGRSVGEILKEAEEVVRSTSKKQIRNKDSKEMIPLSPLLKPDSHLVINLTEKSDADDSEDSEGVYVRRERIIPGTSSKPSNVQESFKLPFEDNITSHADKIFKQIELEVKNKIAASKGKQSSAQIVDLNDPLINTAKKESNSLVVSKTDQTNEDVKKVVPEKLRSSFSPLRGEPLSIVVEESASDASSLEADPAIDNSKPAQESLSTKSSQGKDITTQKLEDELLQEKKAFEKLKGEMNKQVEDLKKQIEVVKSKSQEKRFALEKDVSILKATLASYEKKARPELGGGDYKRPNSGNAVSSQRLKLLEDEMQKQEQLIIVYQNENVKLCQDLKLLKQELKVKESQIEGALPLSARRITVAEASEKEILTDQLKGKDVHISQLNAKIEELQNDKKHSEEFAHSLKLANVQMQGEIEKNKTLIAELKSKDTSQAMSALKKELDIQKADSARKSADLDRLHRDLRRTTEELETRKTAMKAVDLEHKRNTDMWNDKLKELQLELDEERAFSEEERRKHEEDEEKIERLSKQVKEIEQLMKTNRSNSIPPLALPVSADGEARKKADTPRIKFLEDRIHQLEDELESAKNVLDSGFEGIQVQYKALKDKYDMNTEQLTKELAAWKKEAATWKETAQHGNPELDINKQLKDYAVSQKVSKPHLFANAIAVKEDAHLIATIRGLKNELISKDRSIRGLEKKLSEAMKTNKRLQAEREKVLAQPIVTKAPPVKITPPQKLVKRVEESKDVRPEMRPFLERQKEMEFTVSQLQDNIRIKDSQIELLTIELREVRERRLRDLEELQEEHDEEIAQLMSKNSSNQCHNRYSELDGKLIRQEQVISRLTDQLKVLDEHRAENLVLKVERENLERNLKEANKKLALLRQAQSPDQSHYEALLDKIADLELRHESREQNLQAVVRDLLRTKSDQGDSNSLREQLSQKNRELRYYKLEMNKIIGKVTFLENELIGQEPKSNSGRK